MSTKTDTSQMCRSCAMAQALDSTPFIYIDDLWTVNMFLGVTPKPLLGWVVLQPRRHVRALHEFTPQEQVSMGQVLAKCDTAMCEVLGVERVYACLFAEDPNFHLHFHLIPRRADLPREYVGPAAFALPAAEFGAATVEEIEQVRVLLREALMNQA